MSHNRIVYKLPLSPDESLENIDASIAHFAETFASKTTFHVATDEEFLGLHFNLHGDFTYTLKDLSSGKIPQNCFNVVYVPQGTEISYVLRKGKHAMLCIQYPLKFLQLWGDKYPLLPFFFAKMPSGNLEMITPEHHPITQSIYDIIIKILHDKNYSKLRNISLRPKLYDILKLCLIRVHDTKITLASRSDDQKVTSAHDYLLRNVQFNFSQDFLAEKFDIQKTKLTEGFKKKYKVTIITFLIDERLKKAKILLLESDLSLKNVAEAIGYKHQRHFSDIFKKKFGKSPGEFRRDGY
jgi:AraC-like DNA-binding protein